MVQRGFKIKTKFDEINTKLSEIDSILEENY